MKRIGARILEYRFKHGLRQFEFAKLLGFTGAAVGQWERDVNVPTKDSRERLERVLNGKAPVIPGKKAPNETYAARLVGDMNHNTVKFPVETLPIVERVCLKCDREFEARGKLVRICDRCHAINAGQSPRCEPSKCRGGF